MIRDSTREREERHDMTETWDKHDRQGRHGIKHKEENMETEKGKKTQGHSHKQTHREFTISIISDRFQREPSEVVASRQ